MSEKTKWKCDICGQGFNNFHAQGFDGKIYCPLCYFKRENRELHSKIDKAIEYINRQAPKGYNFGWVLENHEIKKILEILKGDDNE